MKGIILFTFFLSSSLAFAQRDALVFFTDKARVNSYLASPQTMLTKKALDRKEQHGTSLDVRDVPVNEIYISALKNSDGIQVLAKSKWMNCAFVNGSRENIQNLLNLNFIRTIEFADSAQNMASIELTHIAKLDVKSEKVNYNYGSALTQTEMIAIDKLHMQDFLGQGMSIAIMDSGFPNIAENPAFSGLNVQNRLLGTYDFVLRQENVEGTGTHGSIVLSDMAGNLNNTFMGTSPEASYYLFRTEFAPTENPVEEAWWVEALERADSLGVDVVNTSLGYRDFDDPAYNHSYQDLDGKTTLAARGANIAFEKGLLIVTSAGNDGQGDFKTVATPADSPNVLSIGAVDANGSYAQFSSIGPTVDGRVKPDLMAQGEATAVVDTSGQIDFVNGTSFSSPIIAGAVACLWQALPTLNNFEIMQLVRESASQFQNPTDEMGYGIPDFEMALNNGQLLTNENKLLQEEFVLYGNPVENSLTISLPKLILEGKIQFFDLLGQEVMDVKLSSPINRIDVSPLTTGIYIALVSSGDKVATFKVIKK